MAVSGRDAYHDGRGRRAPSLLRYDGDLEIETYRLSGIVQKFPNHFHDCYVIGLMIGGGRHLWCRGAEYDLSAGDIVLLIRATTIAARRLAWKLLITVP